MEYHMVLLMPACNVGKVLYLEKGLVSYHDSLVSVVWQNELEAMYHKSHCKYNADENVNADTLKLNSEWLDNGISL